MTIWLTRPNDDSQLMSDLLSRQGIPSIIGPVMDIMPLTVEWPDRKPDAILLTSRYGARALAKAPAVWHDLPVYCSGPTTAQAAQQQGFRQVVAAETGVVQLLPQLRANHAGCHVLYPSGEDIKLDVGPLLARDGITVERVIAYSAIARSALSNEVLNALTHHQLQGVIFASQRAVAITTELLTMHKQNNKGGELDLYCLSIDIATDAARLMGGKNIFACRIPSYDAMMELLLKHATKVA